MNEPLPPQPPVLRQPPGKKLCAFYGFLILAISGPLCIVFPPAFLFGFIAAFVSLFIQGYRCIFLGYVLTIGVLLLGTIIYCANHPFDMK